MLIYNPTTEVQRFRAQGNYFEMKPEQIKNFNEDIGRFITLNKSYLGLVVIPDLCVEDPNSADAKELKAKAKTQGIESRVQFLKGVIYNHEVSLRQDLDRTNDQSNVDVHLNKDILAIYRELAAYQQANDDYSLKQADEVSKIREKLKK